MPAATADEEAAVAGKLGGLAAQAERSGYGPQGFVARAGSPGKDEEIGGVLDLVIPKTVKPMAIIALHKWLRNVPGLSVIRMDKHPSGDTVFHIMIAIPRALIHHLLSSPDVSDVIDESPPVRRNAERDEFTGLPIRERRFRLAFA